MARATPARSKRPTAPPGSAGAPRRPVSVRRARGGRRPASGARPNVAQLLGTAVEHHRAGRLAAAEPLYREILRLDPRQPDALHLLGLLASQTGQLDLAGQLIGRAAALAPG